jgi:FkbM family methyltransferase
VNRSHVKTLLRSVGLYPVARQLSRRLSPELRKQSALQERFYRQFVRPGDLCFDIGANLGQTAEILLRCNAHVVAVEPNPLCIQTLGWECGRRRGTTVIQKAVGSKSGVATLQINDTYGTASLRQDWPFALPDQVEVEVTTLDALIRQFGVPAFCKIDVEGYELEVFEGLSKPIACVLFEFHRRETRRAAACLHRLETICGAVSVRVADKDNTEWVTERWLTSSEAVEAIGAVQDRGLGFGNVVVRTAG